MITIGAILFIAALVLIGLVAGFIDELPDMITAGCGILGILCLIVGVSLLLLAPNETTTIIVTTQQGEIETFNECNYNLYDNYIKIKKDDKEIIMYNPKKVEEVEE